MVASKVNGVLFRFTGCAPVGITFLIKQIEMLEIVLLFWEGGEGGIEFASMKREINGRTGQLL